MAIQIQFRAHRNPKKRNQIFLQSSQSDHNHAYAHMLLNSILQCQLKSNTHETAHQVLAIT